MEVLRNDDQGFERFGQGYVSATYDREAPDEYRTPWDTPDIPYTRVVSQ